jgi:hypothetical protein
MTKASQTKMIEPIAAPPDLAALVADVSGADLPPATPKLASLIQAGSADLLDQLEGSAAGDYAVPVPAGYKLVKGATGIVVVPVYFRIAWPEWGPDRSGLVDIHPTKPRDAQWLSDKESPTGKAGHHRLSTRNKVEETVYASLLAVGDGEPFPMSLAFRSSSIGVGKDFAGQAERVVSLDKKFTGAVCGKWRLTSRVEKKLDYRWHIPVTTRLGVFGQPTGPSVDEMRMAAELRRDLKAQASVEQAARLETARAIEGPSRASITITSGRQAIAHQEPPPAPPPPIESYDGPDESSEEINF